MGTRECVGDALVCLSKRCHKAIAIAKGVFSSLLHASVEEKEAMEKHGPFDRGMALMETVRLGRMYDS